MKWRDAFETLTFPFAGARIVCAAAGRGSRRSLRRFAAVAGLPVDPVPAEQPDILLTDQFPEDAVEKRYCFRHIPESPFGFAPGGGMILQHDRRLPPHLSGEWSLLMRLATLGKLLRGEPFFCMHGALLELRPGCGTLLFGHSGVGKSTTVLRCRMAQQKCRADDLILAGIRNGELFAAPLPTPSYLREYYRRDLVYPFSPAVKVEHLFHLCRGKERERLTAAAPEEFLPPLVHAISFHYLGLFGLLETERIRQCGNAVLDFASLLTKLFPMVSCEAHFSGDIVKTLTGGVDADRQ